MLRHGGVARCSWSVGSLPQVTPHHYAGRMAKIQVRRLRSASDFAGLLPAVAVITLITLKLTGIIAWSWWWVLSPMWIGAASLPLLAGILIILWCLGRWPVILMPLFRSRRRRHAPS